MWVIIIFFPPPPPPAPLVNFLNLHILHISLSLIQKHHYLTHHIFVSNDTINKHFFQAILFLSFLCIGQKSYLIQHSVHYASVGSLLNLDFSNNTLQFCIATYICDNLKKMLHIRAYRKRHYCKDHKQQLKSPCWPKLVNCTFLLK